MKKIFPLLAAALLALQACDGLQTARYEDDLALPREEESADTLLLSIDLEYVTKGPSEEAVEQMNSVILTQAFDLEDGPGTVEETAVRYRENLIDEYLTESRFTWEDRISGLFTEKYKGWRNYLLTYYSFRGGAHGIQTLSQIVFDTKTGAVLGEGDFFSEGYQEPVAQLLRKAVRETMTAEAPELLELVQMDAIGPNGNFSVGKDGMEWVFQPYEAGPYALGIISATLDWESLKPYLK
ncbi:MAG: DUF3298 domain-containing protein [Bacteroidales bacterium]|nr:DUF3298 domain-containing protein [Bacteroidales bacterium]